MTVGVNSFWKSEGHWGITTMKPSSGVTKSRSQGKTFVKLSWLMCCSPAKFWCAAVQQNWWWKKEKKHTSLHVILRIYEWHFYCNLQQSFCWVSTGHFVPIIISISRSHSGFAASLSVQLRNYVILCFSNLQNSQTRLYSWPVEVGRRKKLLWHHPKFPASTLA